MHRPRPRLLQQLAEEVAVEPRDGEPLRAARRPRDDVDVLGPQPAFADQIVGVATGQQGKGTHALNASRRPPGNSVIPSERSESRDLLCGTRSELRVSQARSL